MKAKGPDLPRNSTRSGRSAILSGNGADDALRILPQNSCDLDKLNHIEPALSAFVLGHEALRPPKALGNLLLSESGLLASSNEQLSEPDMLWGMDRFAHAGRAVDDERQKLILLSDYPK